MNLSKELTSCISLQNENESFAHYFLGITGSNVSVRSFTDLSLYVPMEENNVSIRDFNL